MVIFDWQYRDTERKADAAYRKLREVALLRSDVDRLECANREIRAEIDWLRAEQQTNEAKFAAFEIMINEMRGGTNVR